jgi:hypothetical protein
MSLTKIFQWLTLAVMLIALTDAFRDLARGARDWFRIAAVSSVGKSGWNDPATKIAP